MVGSQLPTLVLYEEGGEVARLSPQVSWWRPSSALKKVRAAVKMGDQGPMRGGGGHAGSDCSGI